RRAITKAAASRGTPGLHVTSTESAPRRRASASAARTKRVTPLAAMPTTTSPARARRRIAPAPARASSSEPSTGRKTALPPPPPPPRPPPPRRGVERGRTLGGLDDAEATAGPRSDEDQPAPALQTLDDRRHRSADSRRRSAHRTQRVPIGAVHESGDGGGS